MKLGIRCWPDRFAFVVLGGSAARPELIEHGVRKFPTDLSRAGFLNWISNEVKRILGRRRINASANKQIEPKAQKNTSLLHRAEVEGVIQAVLYESGCHDVSGLIKTQLKAALRFEGSAKEISTALSDGPLEEFLGKDA